MVYWRIRLKGIDNFTGRDSNIFNQWRLQILYLKVLIAVLRGNSESPPVEWPISLTLSLVISIYLKTFKLKNNTLLMVFLCDKM